MAQHDTDGPEYRPDPDRDVKISPVDKFFEDLPMILMGFTGFSFVGIFTAPSVDIVNWSLWGTIGFGSAFLLSVKFANYLSYERDTRERRRERRKQ